MWNHFYHHFVDIGKDMKKMSHFPEKTKIEYLIIKYNEIIYCMVDGTVLKNSRFVMLN